MNNIRIFFSDNSVLTDWSTSLNVYNGSGQSFSYVVSEDYIYIGQRTPFNHFYIKMGTTVNAVTATMSLQYWDGKEWVNSVELIDETSSGGKSLAQSGFVTFVPNRDKAWEKESTNYQGDQITGLTSVVIYDLYWIRIKFNATLTSLVGLKWIGHKFCTDNDLAAEFPDLSRQKIRDVYSSGLASYEEQIIRASEVLISDLISKNIIESAGNILVREQFKLACVSKLAELIYQTLGDDYDDNRVNARSEYSKRLDKSIYQVDTNNNAILDSKENVARVGYLSR